MHCQHTVREWVARLWMRMRRVCAGTLVYCEQAVRERVAGPGRRMQRVYTCYGYTDIQ